MTILAGNNWIELLINRYRVRHAFGTQLLRQDDRMLDDIGLTREELYRELDMWRDGQRDSGASVQHGTAWEWALNTARLFVEGVATRVSPARR